VTQFVSNYGIWVVVVLVVVRFIPVIRATLGLMAGAVGMSLPRFLGLTATGCADVFRRRVERA
jgi:membrane protein DedA with SNARE-associated domain